MSQEPKQARPPTAIERIDNLAGRLDAISEELSQRVLAGRAPYGAALGSDDLFVLKDACRHTLLARNLLLRVLKEDVP